ncbi:MAG: hypothetical protein ACTSWL_06080 [Promethearchaeota archaeon]
MKKIPIDKNAHLIFIMVLGLISIEVIFYIVLEVHKLETVWLWSIGISILLIIIGMILYMKKTALPNKEVLLKEGEEEEKTLKLVAENKSEKSPEMIESPKTMEEIKKQESERVFHY